MVKIMSGGLRIKAKSVSGESAAVEIRIGFKSIGFDGEFGPAFILKMVKSFVLYLFCGF